MDQKGKKQQEAHWGKQFFYFLHQWNCGIILYAEGEREKEFVLFVVVFAY